jgi:hypothetical protein|tara:strand:+ start:1902 stop:2183 length:282 start_codon:yes stop_codon:yes gene_type:complete
MICPHCKQETEIEHYVATTWQVQLVIDDLDGNLPIPFWKEHGGEPERGRHHLNIGHTCEQAARDYALRVFPEARIIETIECNILCEPVEKTDG